MDKYKGIKMELVLNTSSKYESMVNEILSPLLELLQNLTLLEEEIFERDEALEEEKKVLNISEHQVHPKWEALMDEYYDRYTELIENRVSNKLFSKGYASSCGFPSNYSYAKGDDFKVEFTMKSEKLATVTIDYIDVTDMRHKFVLKLSENNWLIDEKYYGFGGEDKWYSDRI